MHQVWFAQSSLPASHCLVFAFALLTSSTPCEKPLRSCTLNTQIMHFGHMRCFLSALCYSLARVVFVFTFTFATSAAQIENKYKDKEEFEQWLTAFGRHEVKNLCDRALWRHRLCTLDTRAVSCLPFATFSSAWLLSSPLPASTFATSSAQIENEFKDKEEFEQWLTAFGRHQVKNLCNRALWRHRLCTLDTRAVSCLPFATFSSAWLLSSPLPASTFATSSAQIENEFKDKEEFEQWLTAFGRHQVKNLCNRALWRHRLCTLDTCAVSCLPFVTLSRAWFLSSRLPASTFATSSSQIENRFKDKEECKQWLTAFGCRDREKEVDQLASGCDRYTVLNLVN